MAQQVLLVDDDPVQRRLLEAHVSRMGYRTLVCEDGRAALDALKLAGRGRLPAAMVLDLGMPGLGGLEVMAEMRRADLDVPVVVQTARGSVDAAVEAMRAGAFDFVVKPASPRRLQAAIEQAMRVSAARRRRAAPQAEGRASLRLEAESAAMEGVLRQAARVASSSVPVLIEGETGVGKEWLAEAIRAAGPRAKGPFVAVNCGALPAQLAESILFGHAKGAFTGATERHPGKFAEADGGTLLLDEIGELPPGVQAKLLRALQKGEIDPVGGGSALRTDVRILSATNRSLAEEVAAGRFREDLYFRLNVVTISVPPLRERREEIARLATRFLDEFREAERPGRKMRIGADAMALLEGFDWPGNVRQLENVVHRAVVLSDADALGPTDFPQIAGRAAAPAGDVDAPPVSASETRPAGSADEARPPVPAFDDKGEIRPLDAIEADLLRLAMIRYGGRPSEVARRLGIGRTTLYRKLRRYGATDERPG